ncbi:MAG: hypothetical protein ACTSYJ_00875 [Candidatus Thorarchaeota archaeon]
MKFVPIRSVLVNQIKVKVNFFLVNSKVMSIDPESKTDSLLIIMLVVWLIILLLAVVIIQAPNLFG